MHLHTTWTQRTHTNHILTYHTLKHHKLIHTHHPYTTHYTQAPTLTYHILKHHTDKYNVLYVVCHLCTKAYILHSAHIYHTHHISTYACTTYHTHYTYPNPNISYMSQTCNLPHIHTTCSYLICDYSAKAFNVGNLWESSQKMSKFSILVS